MATSMQINGVLCKTAPIMKNSGFNSFTCQAKTKAKQGRKADFYEVLSLDSKDVSLHEIKKAYRRKALEFHPDASPASSKEESTRRFIDIKLAYEVLSDPTARGIYDYELGLSEPTERKGSWCMEGRRDCGGFCREMLERQLQGLKVRSEIILERRRNQCIKL